MAQFGSGGSGGTINQSIQPFLQNADTFLFLNGNTGAIGSANGAISTASVTNANVGVGGNGAGSSGYAGGYGGGAGGAGGYIKIVYGPGEIPYGTLLNYTLGANGSGGSGGGVNGTNGGIKITWT